MLKAVLSSYMFIFPLHWLWQSFCFFSQFLLAFLKTRWGRRKRGRVEEPSHHIWGTPSHWRLVWAVIIFIIKPHMSTYVSDNIQKEFCTTYRLHLSALIFNSVNWHAFFLSLIYQSAAKLSALGSVIIIWMRCKVVYTFLPVEVKPALLCQHDKWGLLTLKMRRVRKMDFIHFTGIQRYYG